MSRQKELPARSAVPTELKWDLTLLYPDDQAMKDQLEQTVSQAHQLHQLAGHLGDDGETLLKALQMSKSIGEALEREYVYAFGLISVQLGAIFFYLHVVFPADKIMHK